MLILPSGYKEKNAFVKGEPAQITNITFYKWEKVRIFGSPGDNYFLNGRIQIQAP